MGFSNMSLASYTWLYYEILRKANGQVSNFTGCKDIENDICVLACPFLCLFLVAATCNCKYFAFKSYSRS